VSSTELKFLNKISYQTATQGMNKRPEYSHSSNPLSDSQFRITMCQQRLDLCDYSINTIRCI